MVNISKIAVSSDSSLPKWQIALIVSVPVAFGLGYLYYRHRNKAKAGITENGVDASSIISNHFSKQKNDVQQNNAAKILTPLEKAKDIKNLGNNAFMSGDYQGAVAYYSQAIQTCPTEEKLELATFYQNRAAALEKLDVLNEVIDDCTKALDLNERYVKAVVRRAKAYEKLNQLDNALEDMAFASFIETYNSEIISNFERISNIAGKKYSQDYLEMHSTQPSSLPSKNFVKTYLSTFTHGSAIDKLEMNDDTNKKLLKLFKKAEKALLACRRNDAESLCNNLLQECRNAHNELMELEGLVLRGTLYTLIKRNSNALDDLTTVINNDRADSRVKVNALIKRAIVHHHMSQPEKCFEDFHKAEQVDENNPDIYHHLGQIYLISERLPDSVSSFRKATALCPDFPIFAVQHCFVEYKFAQIQGKMEEAEHFLNEFKILLERFPQNVECKTMYSQVLGERNEYTAAENLLNGAIRDRPDHAALYVHKALMLLQWKGEINEARRLLIQALRLDDHCEFAYETLGTIEAQLGHFRTALDYYDRAIAYYPSADELVNLCSTRVAVNAQVKAALRLGLDPGPPGEMINESDQQ